MESDLQAMGRRAQISLEFTFIIIILLFLTITFLVASGDKLSDFKSEKEIFLLKDIAATVRNEVQIAYAMDSGYVRAFQLPDTLEGDNYTVSIQNGFISAAVGNQIVEIAVQPVNGTLIKGDNIIRKVGGNVMLN